MFVRKEVAIQSPNFIRILCLNFFLSMWVSLLGHAQNGEIVNGVVVLQVEIDSGVVKTGLTLCFGDLCLFNVAH